MGGNTSAPTSGVLPYDFQTNLNSVGLKPQAGNNWDSMFGDSNWIGGQVHGSNYLGDNRQVMTSVPGFDVNAGLEANKAWNLDPSHKGNLADSFTNDNGMSGTIGGLMKGASLAMDAWGMYQQYQNNKYNKELSMFKANAAVKNINDSTRSYNNKQQSISDRRVALSQAGTTTAYVPRKELAAFKG